MFGKSRQICHLIREVQFKEKQLLRWMEVTVMEVRYWVHVTGNVEGKIWYFIKVKVHYQF